MAKIFVSYTIVSTGNWFLVAREKDAPLAEVYRSDELIPPHGLRNVTLDNLNPVMHQIELWTTLDGVTLNQLRGRCDIDASQSSQVAFEPLTFVVGRGFGAPNYDPAPDPNDQYDNPDLIDLDYIVFKPGFGPLLWDVHIEKVPTGGFKFINGQVFGDGEEYTIMISNLTTVNTFSSGTGYPDGIVDLTISRSFAPADYRKLLEVNATSNIELQIDDINTIPENMVFGINTHNGSQKYVILKLPFGSYCLYKGGTENEIYIGKGEDVSFIKKGNYLRIINWDGDHRRVGERVYGDTMPPANSLPLIGGWYSQIEYIRAFNWYVNKLPPGELGTGTDDFTPIGDNIRKWIIGLTKFWVPDHRDIFYRVTDGIRLPNNYQADDNKAHNHVTAPYIRASARASDIDGTNTTGSVDSTPGEYRIAGMTNTMWTAATIISQGTESRPKNVAVNGYVII